MGFDTPSGSHGGRQPGGLALRLVNSVAARWIRRRGAIGGTRALILHTVGRKSGEPRTSPVNWFPGPDGSRIIVASAAGAPKHPAWYHNIGAHPDQVAIEVDGATIPVVAAELEGAEREQVWAEISGASAQFAGYQEKTDRRLPVIRLSPRV
ncbi:nitroreductase family deazaflavin-dependent oxidoreductase [Gordonia soli]|uniref:Nitroreductase n=1 Tax=Gordonia soli NBRC 108243 TaxID=1223545 RepID=M0QPB5_9ACTN|nr:nitroreductase family deazaflavin-dependent oxidoreductase [Gordonia soli]GAC70505.1 hypothetical protein GS4_35_00810 [Gordonia soli NBRC 108243]